MAAPDAELESATPQRSPFRRRRFLGWLLGGIAAAPLAAAGFATAEPDIVMRLAGRQAMRDVPYGDGPRQKLDVFRPRGNGRVPVIVFFYGGRWQGGSRAWYRFVAAVLTARGYAVVIPDYRLYPEVRFPDFLADGAKAVRWTRENMATFAGDPGRLFVMGHSAGAYIAAMLALDPQWLNAVGLDPTRHVAGLIGLAGPYDFLPLKDADLVDLFGGADRAITQPITFAEGPKPAALLLTGDADTIVDPGNAVRLAARLRQSGNVATATIYRRLGHFSILAGLAPVVAAILPVARNVDAFVGGVRPLAHDSISLRTGAAR
jgi:acetyl esterase/lipase